MDKQSENTRPELKAFIADVTSSLRKTAKPVWMPSEFRAELRSLLPKKIKPKFAEQILQDAGVIAYKTLKSLEYSDVLRVCIPMLEPSPFHYAVSLRSGAYLSHASAVFLLGLTQQQPKTIYVNKEQSEKPPPEGSMSQESINRAFSRPQRRSNYVFRVESTQIILLSGKATGRAGVVDDATTGLATTCVERTLIDITVRPRYAGGVFQVVEAFRRAIDEIDFPKMLSILSILDYRYPYHQSLGFYLQRAGASDDMLNQLRQRGLRFDFYLDYSIASPSYDESWRVFYPPGI